MYYLILLLIVISVSCYFIYNTYFNYTIVDSTNSQNIESELESKSESETCNTSKPNELVKTYLSYNN